MGQFQFIVSIRRTGTNQVHLGSGALIGPTWILSASSLTSLFVRPADMTIAFGVVNVPTVVAPGFTLAAQEFATNEGLALIRTLAVTCNTARFGFISPIFMDNTVHPNDVSDALVAGWGQTASGPTTQLRFRKVATVDLCGTQTSFCTTGVLCATDIGNPLITASGLIGIATTTPCVGGTDLYARISFYRMWIHIVTGI
ncbi:hypothetical protein ACKWTF_000702 [Chironomus riparius]